MFWVLKQVRGSGFQHELETSVDSNNPAGRVARQLMSTLGQAKKFPQ
jgi:hypothetical protein